MAVHFRPRPANCDGFQIGIITALDLETEAVLAQFEENFGSYGCSYDTHTLDENTYSTGQIAGKPVVLCQLISIGKLIACRAAEQMRLSFRNLSVVFVVGVAGGNPSNSTKPHILLGDVAIGTLVMEMDYGKLYDDKLHRRKGHDVSKPSYRIASFLTSLRPLPKRLSIMHKIDQCTPNRFHPGKGKDILYSANHLHKHRTTTCQTCQGTYNPRNETCEEAKDATCQELGCDILDSVCQTDRDLSRNLLAGNSSVRNCYVHFGVFASGSSVIKSGRHRDLICQTVENVVALEMEGAGVWDTLPTIVVKGICDYADSHKNKEWQTFAAARAATCAKILIEEWNIDKDKPANYSTKCGNKHCTTPISRIPKSIFMGYSDVLNRLTVRILNAQHHEQILFVLAGMGGIGKTEIVLQFLRDSSLRETFWGIFWIDCSTEISAQESFFRIATACGWNVVSLQEIKDRLAGHSVPILLILDNCDNLDVDYGGKYIPFANHIKVVLTGRPKALDRYASLDTKGNQDYQYVDGLSKQSCRDLILFLSKDDMLKSTIADELAALLEYHPLAIHVACSFIRSQQSDTSNYIVWLKKIVSKPKPLKHDFWTSENDFLSRLLDHTTIDTQYGKIYNTFEISIQTLEDKARYWSHSPDSAAICALELLNFAACIDRTNISRDLFTRAWSFETTVMERTADIMTLGLTDCHLMLCRQFLDKRRTNFEHMRTVAHMHVGSTEPQRSDGLAKFWNEKKRRNHGMQDEPAPNRQRELETWGSLLHDQVPDVNARLDCLGKAMARLCAVELATMNDDRTAISLHPVVHSWAKLWRDRNGRKEKAMAISGSLLALAVGDTMDWLPNNTNLRRHMEAYLSNDNWSPVEVHRALDNKTQDRNSPGIRAMLELKDWESFALTSPTAQQISELQLIDKCRIHMTLAYPLVHMRSKKVTEDLKNLVEALKNLSGQAAYGLHLLRTRELLNASLDKTDPVRIPEQEDIVTTIRGRGPNSAHDLLVAQHNLAGAYLEGGRTTEAVKYLQKLEDEYDVGDYEYDNDLLTIQELLGIAYRTHGEPDMAVQILQRVVEKREANEEATNQTLCTAKRELARAYLDASRSDIALQILKDTHKNMLDTRPKDDHFLLLMQQTLAQAWDAVGDWKIAIELLEGIVEIRRENYGLQQPECCEAAQLLKTIKEKAEAAQREKIWEEQAARAAAREADDSWSSMDEAIPLPKPSAVASHAVFYRKSKWGKDNDSEDVRDNEDDGGGVVLDKIIGK